MKGTFNILINNHIETYENTDDIPEFFDNLIEFTPEYPKGPHSKEEHDMIESYADVLMELLKREEK